MHLALTEMLIGVAEQAKACPAGMCWLLLAVCACLEGTIAMALLHLTAAQQHLGYCLSVLVAGAHAMRAPERSERMGDTALAAGPHAQPVAALSHAACTGYWLTGTAGP